MRAHRVMVLAAAVTAGVTACSGSSSSPSTAASGGSSGGGSSSGAVQHPTSLVGLVGHNDAFSISLTDQAGTPITNVAAGTYSLSVKDESGIHNFHLAGSGVDDATNVGDTGTSSFRVTLKPGTYTFVCDPHASQMHGKFTVSP